MIDFDNKTIFKLKQKQAYAEKVADLLMDGEEVLDAFKSMRDGVVFTSKRIIAVNIQGITGSKKAFTSLPYKNIVAFSIETSGTLDIDSELELYFSEVGRVRFEFSGKARIKDIAHYIGRYAL
ncbi:PH domain-containing protein [Microbulbifer sediminum]|uniref:PH domain-containing protein n=1 Tax=Microbulbifer sediminum TaxID=2904250 RepID=UPI001F48DB8A|nr:PH domain-containing protein [Microbulbifer sediminum]